MRRKGPGTRNFFQQANSFVESEHPQFLPARGHCVFIDKRAGAAGGVALLYFFGDRDRHGGYRVAPLSLGPCKSPDFD